MKALVYTGPKTVELHEVPMPEPKAGQVRVRVSHCGICGGDISIYGGKHPRAQAPLIFGHEFIGTIETAASDKFKVGDRVSPYPLISCGHCDPCRDGTPHVCKSLKLIGIDCDGGAGQYVCCDEDVLFKIPDALSDRAAAVLEPLAVVVRTLHQAKMQALDTVAITGAGPIGVLTAIVAEAAGASRVIISDVDDSRLALAKELGYETINSLKQSLVDYVDETTNGRGVDVVFECSGAEPCTLDATKICRVSGTVCITAIYKGPSKVNLQEMNFKEITLVSSRVYTKREYQQAVEFAVKVADKLEKVVTHIVPMEQGMHVFDMIADPSIATVKVLIDCE
ncbi:alcohol dehydrogenase catalytic domain-containing protein [Bengtsoniella intestinalis]|uniref:zinc-dependent alcohol dehydrogenase n=1 Tax=Bengtsoniella intestinalis TaxID=3073143 RepID=UPI00391F9DFD